LVPAIKFLNGQHYLSEIIVVSDGSQDKTKEVAEKFRAKFPRLRVIEYFPNCGKGAAVKKGMSEAKGEYRLFMDADYAVSIEYIPTFLSMINPNYDIVIASRSLPESKVQRHQPFLRELAGKGFGLLQKVVLGLPFFDTQCGFKLFTKTAAEDLFSRITFSCAYFDAELLYIAHHSKMKIGEIAVCWRYDGETRLPIGLRRTAELIMKLFLMRVIHRKNKLEFNSLHEK